MAADYDRLSPLGELQAGKLGEFWGRHGITFQQVISGPARRHLRTCEIAGEAVKRAGLQWPDPMVVKDVDELDAGKVMNVYLPLLLQHDEQVRRLHDEFRAAEKTPEAGRLLQSLFEMVAEHWAEERIPVSEIETWQAFRERVSRAICGIRQSAPKSSSTVVFTSAGPIAATLSLVFDLPPKKSLDLIWTSRNSAYAEFLFTGGRFSLSSYNSFPHLDAREQLTYR